MSAVLLPRGEQARLIPSIALTVLAVLAVLYTLHIAQVVLIPVAVAILLNLLLAPLVRRLRKFGIPTSLSSAAILITLLASLFVVGNSLVDPALEWLNDAPTNLRQISREIEGVKKPLKDVQAIGEEVDEITKLESGGPKTQEVAIKDPDGLDRFMKKIPDFLTSVAITFFTAFFILSAGDQLAQKVVNFGRSWREKSLIIRVCREVQNGVSRHLQTITLINLALGLVVGIALHLLGVPNPALWGAMVALFNFAPYVGAVVSALVLAVVGVTSFETMTEALMVPGVFIVLTSLEGAVITPLVLGRRLNLSPLVVFLAVVFWGWMWGIAGALIAVPIMSSVQVVLANFEPTRPLANLMKG